MVRKRGPRVADPILRRRGVDAEAHATANHQRPMAQRRAREIVTSATRHVRNVAAELMDIFSTRVWREVHGQHGSDTGVGEREPAPEADRHLSKRHELRIRPAALRRVADMAGRVS